jgi:site-specific DNA-cytosine methylase
MPRKLLVADLFCGAGGFTTALLREMEEAGVEVELVAVNHDPIAIATHTQNHPRARHYIPGNEGEITRQIGNAVPVRTARQLIRAALADAVPAGARRTKAVA